MEYTGREIMKEQVSQLSEGEALVVEDLSVTMQLHTYYTPEGLVAKKYKGRVSKSRYKNMVYMANQNFMKNWLRQCKETKYLDGIMRALKEKK